jgi:hypothetical protein
VAKDAGGVKAFLVEVGETLLGATWWGLTWAWGIAMSAMFILAPLLLATIAVELFDWLPATAALGIGVMGAYVLDLPPWDADDPVGLPLVIGGGAITVVAWDLMRRSADAASLVVVLALVLIGWPIRRLRWKNRR